MSRPNLAAIAALHLPSLAMATDAVMRFGVVDVDELLGGGLAISALHEFYSVSQGASAGAIALLLALRSDRSGPIVLVRDDKARLDGRLYGLGLVELGIDPARLLLVEAQDTLGVLRAAADAVACGGVATVILDVHGQAAAVNLTATRRLAMAASRSGVTTLLLRQGEPVSSAAHSRWQVAPAASTRFDGDAPGRPAFALTLLRHRGGIDGFSCILEWDRDRKIFVEAGCESAKADIGASHTVAFKRASATRRQAA